ncbi:MAG: DUF1080 domain-containing protein [Akkermansiaceae bacterium]|nr:DUF1080 domain-containing protein [Akkermansiaceae bacterium]
MKTKNATHSLSVLFILGTMMSVSAVELTDVEKAQGWKVLFDGKSFAGWRSYQQKGVGKGWKVVDGVMHHTQGGGDLITEKQYEDYELSLEWKISEKGNSGIFLAAQETSGPIYHTGIEMQILDDKKHPDGVHEKHRSGGCYGLYKPPADAVKEVGQWNKVHIVKQGDHYRFYLNGIKTADFKTEGDDFKNRVANSKFSKWPYFGRHNKGHIGLQDHGDAVSFRHIKLRELNPVQLFNGADIKNWDHFLNGDTPADKTWSVVDGVLKCTGNPAGYLMTKNDYRDYQIDLEWRWVPGQRAGNSGLLLHAVAGSQEVGHWPKCLEAQLMTGQAGDFYTLGYGITVTDMDTRHQGRRLQNLTDDSEKAHGEWNHMRTVCRGGEVTVFVNGELVNYGYGCTAQQGRICLQSEGAPIEFRKAVLTPIPGK